jgi:hypothetical protein
VGESIQVTITTSSCKTGTVSWACCRGSTSDIGAAGGCTLGACNTGALEAPGKCANTDNFTFTVPEGTVNLTVQVHDGQLAGDVNCSVAGACCSTGGTSSCTNGRVLRSGVCNYPLELSDCTDVPEDGDTPCSTDANCTPIADAAGPCASAACVAGLCQLGFKSNGSTCGNNAPPGATCDLDDYCNGTSYDCFDAIKPLGTVCRAHGTECEKVSQGCGHKLGHIAQH